MYCEYAAALLRVVHPPEHTASVPSYADEDDAMLVFNPIDRWQWAFASFQTRAFTRTLLRTRVNPLVAHEII